MSKFEESRPIQISDGIDFTKARELRTNGTIYDAYETRHYRHHVFAKRLKEGFRTSPRRFGALQKGYIIAANLIYHGLPRYFLSCQNCLNSIYHLKCFLHAFPI